MRLRVQPLLSRSARAARKRQGDALVLGRQSQHLPPSRNLQANRHPNRRRAAGWSKTPRPGCGHTPTVRSLRKLRSQPLARHLSQPSRARKTPDSTGMESPARRHPASPLCARQTWLLLQLCLKAYASLLRSRPHHVSGAAQKAHWNKSRRQSLRNQARLTRSWGIWLYPQKNLQRWLLKCALVSMI